MDKRETRDVEELLRDNESLREQRRAVGDVLRAVARSEGLQPVLDEIVDAARRLCDGEHAQLYLADGELFRIVSHSADLQEAFEDAAENPHARDRTTVIGRVALAREPVQIPDVLADADYSFEGQRIVGYRALLGVPIILDDELIGAIGVGRNVPGAFADEQVELVKTFADQAAIAIANTRLIEAVERQRTELARFVSPQVAELISSTQGEQLLAGHRAYITCLFFDIRGFTAFAETAAPEELFEVLRAYHEVLGELIPAYDATLGRIGFEGRYDYGALGPVTNLASRLSDRAAEGQILIGQRVFAAVEETVEAAPVGELELKGFGRPVPAYEVRELRTAG